MFGRPGLMGGLVFRECNKVFNFDMFEFHISYYNDKWYRFISGYDMMLWVMGVQVDGLYWIWGVLLMGYLVPEEWPTSWWYRVDLALLFLSLPPFLFVSWDCCPDDLHDGCYVGWIVMIYLPWFYYWCSWRLSNAIMTYDDGIRISIGFDWCC
ncbi:hypothetical protein Tco_0010881 [Tanacetum coccineum]